MRRDRLALVVALALASALAPSVDAQAGEAPSFARAAGPAPTVPGEIGGSEDTGDTDDPGSAVRAAIARQLADETAATDRAIATVTDRLAAARLAASHRLRAAYRRIRGAPGASDAMSVARVRAAARLLVERDRQEREVLSDELAQLRAARDRIAGELAQLPSVAPPVALAWPARGKIARHFGTLEHERSKATLSRRGIDIEVDDRSAVAAPLAGTVRYAGPIRGLDQGVILDHGTHVTIVGKLGELAVPVGAVVATGDRLGRAARHRVYLELRVKLGPGGLPLDPEPLLANPR